VRLFLFGQPSLQTASQREALSGYGALVLTWLVLHGRNAPLNARLRLARALWMDTDDDQARRRLVNTLYRLKRDVPEIEAHLIGDASNIGLQGVACDALEFEQHIKNPEPSQWLAALDLYTADLLEGQDLPWLEEWRLQLRELYVAGLDRAILHFENSQPQQAIVYALRLVAADNLSEDAHARLIRLYAKQNRIPEALAQYQSLQDTLAKELGTQPRREMAAFIASLRAAELEPQPYRSLVGRNKERRAFGDQINALKAGHGSIVLLEGEPGMGKTRLLEELIELGRWHQTEILHGSASEQHDMPYAPLNLAIQNASGLLEVATPLMRETLKPLLEESAQNSSANAVSAALERWLGKLEVPVLLVLDDIQWAGDLFWAVLPALTRVTRQKNVLLVLAYRSQELRSDALALEAVSALRRDSTALHLELQGLSLQECETLAEIAKKNLNISELTRLHQLSGGNPFVFLELLSRDRIADKFEEILQSRLTTLAPNERLAVEVASILGNQFKYAEWEILFEGIPPITKLIEARFVFQNGDTISFQHDLVRLYVYQQLSENMRIVFHTKAFEKLQKTSHDSLLIYHAESANKIEKSISILIRSTERAIRLGSIKEAERILSKIVEISEKFQLSIFEKTQIRILKLRAAENKNSNYDINEIDHLNDLCKDNNFLDLIVDLSILKIGIYRKLGSKSEFFEYASDLCSHIDIFSHLQKVKIYLTIAQTSANSFYQTDYALPLVFKVIEIFKNNSLEDNVELYLEALCIILVIYFRKSMNKEAKKYLFELNTLIENNNLLKSFKHRILFFEVYYAYQELKYEEAILLRLEELEAYRTLGNKFAVNKTLENLIIQLNQIGQHKTALVWAEELLENTNTENIEINLLAVSLSSIAEIQAKIGNEFLARKYLNPIIDWLNQNPQGNGAVLAWRTLGFINFQEKNYRESYYSFLKAIELRENPLLTTNWNLLAAQSAIFANMKIEAEVQFKIFCEHFTTQADEFDFDYTYFQFLINENPIYLEKTRNLLMKMGLKLKNLEYRMSFLYKANYHPTIYAFWQQQDLITGIAELSRPDGIGTREITWTLDSGASDASILAEQGKVALRRHRLQRLALEAAVQDAAPTQNDLAEALGVTLRTIEMDLAALRKDGIELRTLGTLQAK
jgi:DNA-binding SARP family transcriptional activator/tetratricopeptide (TPR) repeat protein